MRSQWSSCPPHILARVFSSQKDLVNNSAAACACKSWQHVFCCSGSDFQLYCTPLRAWPESGCLQQFQRVASVLVRGSHGWHDHSNWNLSHPSTVPAEHLQSFRQHIVDSIPASCQDLALENMLTWQALVRPRSRTAFTFTHLTQLRHLCAHDCTNSLLPLETLAPLQTLEVLQLTGYGNLHNCSGVVHALILLGGLQVLP